MANDPYGLFGNLGRFRGQVPPDTSGLPDWLRQQITDNVSVDEGGSQIHNYGMNGNPYDGFRGQDGQFYVQIGDSSKWGGDSGGGNDGGVIDQSRIQFDPNLGYITTADNIKNGETALHKWGGRLVQAAILAGGAYAAGGAAGLYGAPGEAAAAGSGAGGGGLTVQNTGLSGLFQGTPTVSPYAVNEATVAGLGAGGAAGGATGSMTGAAGNESAGLLTGQGAPVTDLSVNAAQPAPWYQQAMQSAMNNPMNAARTGLGIYSMLNANQGNVGGNPGGGDFSVAGGPIPQFDPLKASGPFQQNPYLAQQMFNVPFMGSFYHGLGV